jgi:hypothetical protein
MWCQKVFFLHEEIYKCLVIPHTSECPCLFHIWLVFCPVADEEINKDTLGLPTLSSLLICFLVTIYRKYRADNCNRRNIQSPVANRATGLSLRSNVQSGVQQGCRTHQSILARICCNWESGRKIPKILHPYCLFFVCPVSDFFISLGEVQPFSTFTHCFCTFLV